MIKIRKSYLVKNYEIFTGEDLIIADLIQRRRYQILIHSCIYYNMHSNIVEDCQWDRWAKELVALQQEHQVISEKVVLYEYFEDFDGSTGFDLPIEEDWVIAIASKLLRTCGKLNTIAVKDKKVEKPKAKKRRLF